ncbi:MAG: endonuclease [Alloprevotella sp.]|nr:endonuclease [Alloprevotella sp.]
MKRLYSFLCIALIGTLAYAQIPSGYYSAAKGKSGEALKTALCKIIYSHTQRTYDQLWADYKTTDMRDDGYIYDMYSGITNYSWQSKGVTTSKEGSGYNREHSFPKSWFSEGYPMYTDLHHLVPSDGWVNSCRSNNPFGEVGSTYKYSSGEWSKWGKCNLTGYTGTVFEPNDTYKGDFARIYFYMATAYEDQLSSWSCDILDGSTYPVYEKWQLNMLLTWAINDPVSEKEIKRNNAIYSIQKNRNPYVDFPGLEQIVWGAHTDMVFDPDNYDSTAALKDPGGYDGAGLGGIDEGGGSSSEGGSGEDNKDYGNKYVKVTSASELIDGDMYLIVAEGKSVAAGYFGSTRLYNCAVTIKDNVIETEVNGTDQPRRFTLKKVSSAASAPGVDRGTADRTVKATTDQWGIYDETGGYYLALTSAKNAVNTATDLSAKTALWTIDVTTTGTTIKNVTNSSYSLQQNKASGTDMFRCYTTSQAPVNLYHFIPETITGVDTPQVEAKEKIIYDIYGRRVQNPSQGIYIINGKKVLIP